MSRPASPRRHWLCGIGGLGLAVLLRPALATPESLAAAVQALTQGAAVQTGKVGLTIAELVENGNAVPVSVQVDSPMTVADRVQRIALFTERNPRPEVAVFEFGPAAARARVDTRLRLATSQKVLALAQLGDGSWWQHSVEVVVTLAACVE
jgi:sulfur-oxidizing protein SoxY